jgi:predicted Zn-ribbon and HTH transcriptional regulator
MAKMKTRIYIEPKLHLFFSLLRRAVLFFIIRPAKCGVCVCESIHRKLISRSSRLTCESKIRRPEFFIEAKRAII